MLNEVLKQVIFLAVPCEQPVTEALLVGGGDIGDTEAAPVEVYGFRGVALEVCAAEGEDVLAVLADTRELVSEGVGVWCEGTGGLRDAFVG